MTNQEIYYRYFKPVVSKEHMLFAKEIADMYNILTVNDKPATTFISAYLQEMCKEIPNYEQLYFVTKNGPAKVYPKYIYHPLMLGLKSKINKTDWLVTITIKNKKYNIKLGGK